MRTLALWLALAAALRSQTPTFERLVQPVAWLPKLTLTEAPRPEVFALGESLFSDPILSRDRSVSCRSCHLPELAFTHGDPRPPGIDGRKAKLHAPSLINRAYGKSQRWDGSVPTLEGFVLQPIEDPDEMGFTVDEALPRLREDPDFGPRFAKVFGQPAQRDHLASALATFVRGIVGDETPYDRFIRGEVEALTVEEKGGFWLFESRAGCWQCHTAPLFTDEGFHNTGVGAQDQLPEPGRFAFTKDPTDRGRFKTPTLRGIARSAPFMHDGSLATLSDVIDFYDRGGHPNSALDPKLKPLSLDSAEKSRLLAFLKTL